MCQKLKEAGYWLTKLSCITLENRLHFKTFFSFVFQVYAPSSDHSEQEIVGFHEQLEKTKQQAESQDLVMVMGDLNAKV